jgi:site-specific recombinase XerD
MRGKRDRAIIAILFGCGRRRSEGAELSVGAFSSVMNDGSFSTFAAKAATSELCRFPTG